MCRRRPFIGEAMSRAIAAGHVFYTHQNGIPELRQALADYLTGLGQRPISSERVTVTASGMNAIQLAIQLTCEPGDNIIAVDPVWPNTGRHGAAGFRPPTCAQARMDHGPSKSEMGGRLGARDTGKAWRRRSIDRTRAVFFASPGNPTGHDPNGDPGGAAGALPPARGLA